MLSVAQIFTHRRTGSTGYRHSAKLYMRDALLEDFHDIQTTDQHPHFIVMGDLGGAQQAGLQTALVQTGKYRADFVQASGIKPDHLLSSIADLASLIAS